MSRARSFIGDDYTIYTMYTIINDKKKESSGLDFVGLSVKALLRVALDASPYSPTLPGFMM